MGKKPHSNGAPNVDRDGVENPPAPAQSHAGNGEELLWLDPSHTLDMVRYLLGGTAGTALMAGKGKKITVSLADKTTVDRVTGFLRTATQNAIEDALKIHEDFAASIADICRKAAGKMLGIVGGTRLQSPEATAVFADVARALEQLVADLKGGMPTEDAVMPLMDGADAMATAEERFVADQPAPATEAVSAAASVTSALISSKPDATAPAPAAASNVAAVVAAVSPHAWKDLPTEHEQLEAYLAWKPTPLTVIFDRMRPLLQELRGVCINDAVRKAASAVKILPKEERAPFDPGQFRRMIAGDIKLEEKVMAWVTRAVPGGVCRDRQEFSQVISHFMAGIQMAIAGHPMLSRLISYQDIVTMAQPLSFRLRQSALSVSGNRPSGHFALSPEETRVLRTRLTTEIFPETIALVGAGFLENVADLRTEISAAAGETSETLEGCLATLIDALQKFQRVSQLTDLQTLDDLLYMVDLVEVSMEGVLERMSGGIEKYPLMLQILRERLPVLRSGACSGYIQLVKNREA